jgi:hypothetical protein
LPSTPPASGINCGEQEILVFVYYKLNEIHGNGNGNKK